MSLSPHKLSVGAIVIGLERGFEIRYARLDSNYVQKRIALIPPQTKHHLIAKGQMLFVYLDSLGDDFTKLEQSMGSVRTTLKKIKAIIADSETRSATQVIEDICQALALTKCEKLSMRLEKALRQVDRHPEQFTSIAQAAQLMSLSPSRFQHLIQTEIGLPFRRYRLWRRMALVTRNLQAGHSLTQAAHQAGFASSAHLSSKFREMFGIRPSDLKKLLRDEN
jgi:AraC-like DNA-binding protein